MKVKFKKADVHDRMDMKNPSASSKGGIDKVIYYLTIGTCSLAVFLFAVAVITLLNYDDSDLDVNNGFVESEGGGWTVLTIGQDGSDDSSGIIGIKKIQTSGFLDTYVNPNASGNESQTLTPLSNINSTVQDSNTQDNSQSVNGRCDGNVVNGCSAGSLSDVSDNSSHYRWLCVGLNGGGDASCSKVIPLGPVNGVCDVSRVNGCSSGGFSDVSDNSSHYLWECAGLNGGSGDSCESVKPAPVAGVCDVSRVNGCSSGGFSDVSDNSSHHLWTCLGLGGGSNDSCEKVIYAGAELSALCGTTGVNQCVIGTLNDVSDNSSHHLWTCLGLGGGSDASCNRVKTGVCDVSRVNGCSFGEFSDVSDNSSHYQWFCETEKGYAAVCSKRKPPEVVNAVIVNGACDRSGALNGCWSGTLNDIPDSPMHYKWECMGSEGRHTATCYILKPVNGVCSETKYRCTAGNSAWAQDTTLEYRWICRGKYGGSNASCNVAVPADPRVTIERTTSNNKSQLIVNVNGSHVSVAYTQELSKGIDTACDSSHTPYGSKWPEIFGPKVFGLDDNGNWPSRASWSYKITQRSSSNPYVCVRVVYGTATSHSNDLEYSYHLWSFVN